MKIKTFFMVFALLIGGTYVSAQTQSQKKTNNGQQNKEMKPSGDMAKQRAQEMKTELSLTDKQYNDLYSLFQSEEKERSSKMEKMKPDQQPSADGSTAASAQKGNKTNTTDSKPERPQMSAEMEAQMQKDMAQQDAKVKKILTTEQYEKWKKNESGRRPQQQQGQGKKTVSK